MKILVKSLVFVVVFLANQNVLSTNIDSLYRVSQSGTNSERISAYLGLSQAVALSQHEKALDYAEQGLTIAYQEENEAKIAIMHQQVGLLYGLLPEWPKAIENYKKALEIAQKTDNHNLIGTCGYALGKSYLNISEFNSGIEYSKLAIKSFSKLDNTERLANAYNLIALLYQNNGREIEALKYLMKGMDIAERTGNEKANVNIRINIGSSYATEDKLDKSLEHFQKALDIATRINYKKGMAAALNNIGDVYNRQEKYNLAKAFFQRSIELDETQHKRQSVASYNNIGEVYQKQRDFHLAKEYFQKALEISKRNEDRAKELTVLNNLGILQFEQGNYKYSIQYLKKCNHLAVELKQLLPQEKAQIYLAKNHEKLGNTKKALEAYKRYITLKDSIAKVHQQTRLDELQLKYDLKQKEEKIDALMKDKTIKELQILNDEKSRTIWTFIIIGIIALLVFMIFGAYFLYSRYTESQSVNEKLSEKNKIIESQRSRILTSINYAKRIQDSMLMGIEQLQQIIPYSFVHYLPRDIVSGDLYWVKRMDRKIIVVAADCTGHGVPGAFLTMITNMLLNRIVEERGITDPAEILKALDAGIVKTLNQHNTDSNSSEGMDVSICVINEVDQVIEYAGAMNPLYVVQSHQLIALEPTIASLGGKSLRPGKKEKKVFKTQTISYNNDTSVYMLTDGYVDQFGGSRNSKFNTNKFKEMILEIYQNDIKEQKKTVERRFDLWKGDQKQVDDVLVLGFRL